MGEQILLEGISREAAEEAEKILKQAEKQAETKRAGLKMQVENIRRQSEEEIEKKLLEIRKRSSSTIKSASRRASLKYREELFNRVLIRADEKLRGMINTPQYPDLQAKLIAEGMIGLNRDEAVVSVSHLEELQPAVLKKAVEMVKKTNGREVKLVPGGSLTSQGVSVASADGRISFNNQISTRFRRYDQQIKKIVYEELEKKE